MAVPKSLEESAKIDGASDTTILLRIYIPVSKPVLATVTLWTMVYHWNAWFDSMIYISDGSKQVLQIMLRKIIRSAEIMSTLGIDAPLIPESLKAATIIVVTVPILLVYPLLQKYYIQGILMGSLKG